MPTISSPVDYRQILSEIIRKQIMILGSDLTLTKVRRINGISVQENGSVTTIVESKLQETMHELIDTFLPYSGPIVKNGLEHYLKAEGSTTSHASSTIDLPDKL